MTTYYVATTGSNGNNGSIGSPWLTLAHAYDNSVANDTIYIAAGTYAWVTDDYTTGGGRTVIGADARTTIFDAADAVATWTFHNSTFNISNLTFTNNLQNATEKSPFSTGTGGSTTTPCTVNFNNCIFHNIEVNSSSDNLRGVLFNTTPIGATNSTNKTFNIINCLIYDIRQHTTSSFGALIGSRSDPCAASMIGCTVYLTTGTVNQLFADATTGAGGLTLTLKNNIFANFSGITVNYNFRIAGEIESYNDWYLITGSPSGTGDITSDPLFVDAPNGDFRLRPASPCIGAGTLV